MKGQLSAGIPVTAAGLLIALGPMSIFPVCRPMGGMIMKCFWTGQAELGVGLVIAVLGVLTILVKTPAFRLGLSIAVILNAVVTLLLPTVLIGVCGKHDMICRLAARPALLVIAILLIIGAGVNAVLLYQKAGKEK